MHDHVDGVDMDAAGGDVGGDEDRHLAGHEIAQRALTRPLAEVAVDGAGQDPLTLELHDQAVGTSLRAHEHQRARHAARDGCQHLHLVHLVDLEEAVLHLLDRGLVWRTSCDTGSCM